MLRKTLLRRPTALALLIALACLVSAAGLPAAAARPGADPAPVEYHIALYADGRWTGETRVAPQAAALATGASAVLGTQGDDPREIVQTVLDAACADDRLAGPIALDLSGTVRAGEVFSLTLPANPSTGYSWEIVDGWAVSQVGEVESHQVSAWLGAPAREVIRFRATETGQATVRLHYRRSWEDAPSVQVVVIRPQGLDLAAACALLSLPLPPPVAAPVMPTIAAVSPSPFYSAVALPSAFNWCDKGGCTPVKDQGQCGSCWAFATVGVLESAIKIQENLTTDLSEQYLVSCNIESPKWGCDGGWFAHDYHLDKKPPSESEAGAVLEFSFPYVGRDDPCNGPYSHPYRITSWRYVGSSPGVPAVDAIKQAIYTRGPVAAAVCAGKQFENYSGGVFSTSETCSNPPVVNHAIILVGWDDSKQAWRLRNSWGTGWGEGGYMWIKYGTSNVGYAANYIVYTQPFTPSHWVYLPLVLRNYEIVPVLRNGDFESGRDGSWGEFSSNGWPLIYQMSGAHSGNWLAWLGGGDNETSILSQRVTIPANATTLNYWYGSVSDDLCGYDYAYVRFGASTLWTADLCNDTGGWVWQQIDVSGWRGQTVDLRFVVTTDEALSSSFFLDDVSLSTTTGFAASSTPPVQPWGTWRPRTAKELH